MPTTPPELIVDVRPDEDVGPLTSRIARAFAAFWAASVRPSSDCDLSHQTVAFCLRMRATYEVGVLVPVEEREDVLRRGTEEAVEPVVGARCIDIVGTWLTLFIDPAAEGCRECVDRAALCRESCMALC